MAEQPPTPEQLSRLVLRHARAILDRTPAPSGAIMHTDQQCHVDALAIATLIEQHGRRIDREADRIARGAAERAGDYINDHVSDDAITGETRYDGVRHALDVLASAGLDEIADTGPVADAARRLRRECGPA